MPIRKGQTWGKKRVVTATASGLKVRGKPLKKEHAIYNVASNPKRRMEYCSIFYNLWRYHRAVSRQRGVDAEIWRKFIKYFNRVYRACKRENRKMTFFDFRELTMKTLLKQ